MAMATESRGIVYRVLGYNDTVLRKWAGLGHGCDKT
jgi:hypothetical protein